MISSRRKVLGPLDHLAGMPVVRIVLDGFDQLPDVTRSAVAEALGERPVSCVWSSRPAAIRPSCPPAHVPFDRTRRDISTAT